MITGNKIKKIIPKQKQFIKLNMVLLLFQSNLFLNRIHL